jgi:hypothetical protein
MIWELSNLHGMTTSLSCLPKPSRNGRWVSWPNRKHNNPSVMHILVRMYREDLLGLGDPWHKTEVDIFDALLVYKVTPEPIPVNYTLAIIMKERAGGCEIVFAVTLVNRDWRSGAERHDQ